MSIYVPIPKRYDIEWIGGAHHRYWAGRAALGPQKRVRAGHTMPGYTARALMLTRKMPRSWWWSSFAVCRRVEHEHRRKSLRRDLEILPPWKR